MQNIVALAVILLVAFCAPVLAFDASQTLAAGASLGRELGSLDFSAIIGGPLQATVKAQALAAQTTINFIDQVGFTPVSSDTDSGQDVMEVTMVRFNYKQLINGTETDLSMEVPFLFMVPIPYLQVDLITIDLIVKLNSVANVSANLGVNTQSSFGQTNKDFWGNGQSAFNCNTASQYQSENSASVTDNYSLVVHVQGSQAPMPEGMSRLFDVFESIIQIGATAI